MLADHLHPFSIKRTQLESLGGEVVRPAVDICDSGCAYHISCDLPGLEKDNIEIGLAGRILSIKAASQLDLPCGMKVHAMEFSGLLYRLELELPPDAETAELEASYLNGVLCLNLPKKKQRLGRRICVRGA